MRKEELRGLEVNRAPADDKYLRRPTISNRGRCLSRKTIHIVVYNCLLLSWRKKMNTRRCPKETLLPVTSNSDYAIKGRAPVRRDGDCWVRSKGARRTR